MRTPKQIPLESRYDFIVCGGGASGGVVARRLAECVDVTVLLLEAGGDDRIDAVRDSTVWMSNIDSERDWRFRAEPSAMLNGRSPALPMGKVLGGGSSINGLIWARGHKHDFDHWAAEAGDARWSYDSVVDVYKRIEKWSGPDEHELRGRDGLMEVSLPANPVPVAEALVEASAALGIPRAVDLNGKTMEGDGGCGIPNVTVRGERERVSVASAYVRPFIGRPNLSVALHARVDRLCMDGKRVSGVEVTLADGSTRVIAANHEVILSTGAINTPRILMLSGIGDEQQLKAHGIPVVQHLPGVGQNFQDHILVAGCVWEYVTPEAPRNNSAEFTFFSKSDAALATPDLQPVLEECAFGSEITRAQFGLPSDPSVAWTLAPGLVRPESRGHIELTGKRPEDRVAIHANFLSDERDVTALVKAIELCREIGNSPLLRPFVRRELMPGPLRGEALVSFLRNAAGTYFHQTCTAKMGRDAMSVVDAGLKVHGIDGLRIADGSIMPSITTGNTMAPCVMIGEQAADLIRRAHGLA
jgi:choline dehydrogenase